MKLQVFCAMIASMSYLLAVCADHSNAKSFGKEVKFHSNDDRKLLEKFSSIINSSLENSDEVYYAVFAPTETQKWKGNLKRYRLDKDGAI